MSWNFIELPEIAFAFSKIKRSPDRPFGNTQ
uniref:Uncharacterized protein n=1 Tax=Utricularia reniformis TaxID=192314 RepID=A0A1Y0B393_9LAMI|nr:hypothetical protein AEK19_MT1686 [Utricularia reniformis]ART31868.1 hypothetical protein AEK19_MT1686 [Utricularia reniformis]